MLEASVAQALSDSGRTVAITGASGWIGLATLELLEQALGDGFDARVRCFGSARRELKLRSGRSIIQQPLDQLSSCDGKAIWLLHFAFQTKDRAEALSEEAYRAANDAISDTVRSALDRIPVEAMFVASSGAASKATDLAASPAMRLYGQMKLDDEERFAAWARKSGHRAVIGRIFNITGRYINKHQSYAIANFILDAVAQRPIQVKASREVFRGYVAIRELMSLVFALLGDMNVPLIRFDSGGEELELGAVAHVVADALGGGQVERAPITDVVPDHYVGEGGPYAELLARYGIEAIPLKQQVIETASYLSEVST